MYVSLVPFQVSYREDLSSRPGCFSNIARETMAQWNKINSRGNVDDRRSMMPLAIGGATLTGLAVVFLVSFLGSGDLGTALDKVSDTFIEGQSGQTQNNSTDTSEFAGTDSYEVFVSTILGSTNDFWSGVFMNSGQPYSEPTLVLFRQATQSGCGGATSDVGPHYCSYDTTVYLDETFFDEMTIQYGAQVGDVAQAYVIAHEVGHHVQYLLGKLDQLSSSDNEMSVAVELQADCYAGMWANSIRDEGIFEQGEIQEAMDAAASVGDDRIQEAAYGYSNPETFTHGTSEERVYWFTMGYKGGDMSGCEVL